MTAVVSQKPGPGRKRSQPPMIVQSPTETDLLRSFLSMVGGEGGPVDLEAMITSPRNEWIALTQYPTRHPWPTVSSLRWMYFNRESNGLATAFRKTQGRVLINPKVFFELIERGI